MYKVYCDSGLIVDVDKEIVDILHKRMEEGCVNFQNFQDSKGVNIIINISKIECIIREKINGTN